MYIYLPIKQRFYTVSKNVLRVVGYNFVKVSTVRYLSHIAVLGRLFTHRCGAWATQPSISLGVSIFSPRHSPRGTVRRNVRGGICPGEMSSCRRVNQRRLLVGSGKANCSFRKKFLSKNLSIKRPKMSHMLSL